MPRLYNRSGRVFAVGLSDGTLLSCPPHQWMEVANSVLAATSVRQALAKKLLVRDVTELMVVEEPVPAPVAEAPVAKEARAPKKTVKGLPKKAPVEAEVVETAAPSAEVSKADEPDARLQSEAEEGNTADEHERRTNRR